MRAGWIVGTTVGVVLAVPFAMAVVRPDDANSVEVRAAGWRELKSAILASGTLAYEEHVQLTPEVIGKISEVLVREGDAVQRGQVVLRISPESYRAEVAQQEAMRRQSEINIERQRLNVANQEREAARFERLLASGMVERSRFDNARYQADLAQLELRASSEMLHNADAQLALSRERLAKTEIRSPLGGKVIGIAIKVGETAVASSTNIAGSSLMTIADDRRLIAEVNVDEADIARVMRGQAATIVAAAYPDRTLQAIVEAVSLAPKSNTQGQGKSYLVKLWIEDRQGIELRTGMSCRVEILTAGQRRVLAVPVQAVLPGNPQKQGVGETGMLFVSRDGHAEKRSIELGGADDTYVEIRSGLSEGELVVIGRERELKQLKPGDRINHRPSPQRPE